MDGEGEVVEGDIGAATMAAGNPTDLPIAQKMERSNKERIEAFFMSSYVLYVTVSVYLSLFSLITI